MFKTKSAAEIADLQRQVFRSIESWRPKHDPKLFDYTIVKLVERDYGIKLSLIDAIQLNEGVSVLEFVLDRHTGERIGMAVIFGFIAFLIIGVAVLLAFTSREPNTRRSSVSARHTDGVYESATEKMDRGIPLNAREEQRINDILDYKQNDESRRIEEKNGER